MSRHRCLTTFLKEQGAQRVSKALPTATARDSRLRSVFRIGQDGRSLRPRSYASASLGSRCWIARGGSLRRFSSSTSAKPAGDGDYDYCSSEEPPKRSGGKYVCVVDAVSRGRTWETSY
eukprot:TRINITY_DN19288_c0_g1_i1.p1 TRINITY_DN19288_c0_g1~~TRINITY_DN19288_c0_g1_i1.p1  ORF type:complete len:119 (+),score=3.48 TRINITY_DN19288_c0_g1_i1:121-477(+)